MDTIRVAKVQDVLLDRANLRSQGVLHLTPHHLIFTQSDGTEDWTPYPHITVLHRLPQTHAGLSPICIRTRNFETLTFSFKREKDSEDVWMSVKDLCLVSNIDQLYAFQYRLPSSVDSTTKVASANIDTIATTGWDVYSPKDEFTRMGVGSRSKAWRFTDINKDYAISPTYPAKMVVPSKISDSVLAYACKYRSKARIPALSYLHWANHASITRCSQPLVGLKNNRSNQDERLIEAIFQTHVSPETPFTPPANEYGTGFASMPSSMGLSTSASSSQLVYGATATNLIVDARPTANAMANMATGAGTENMENYKSARKTYLGIENIHVMRDSLKKVETALQRAETTGMLDRHLLRRSNWLKHISAILEGVLLIVRNVHINSSHVLIHCSDGWDRTSQLSAMAQLCLDPYFRTIKGFQVLVEKDWVSFGHKFLDRCGHLSPDKLDLGSPSKPDEEEEERNEATKAAQALFGVFQKQFTPSSHHVKETSPVFHQFLDCIRQMQFQFPDRFEFNSKFLEDLYYHLYSCQFGTFIHNTERQRRMPGGVDDDNASLLVASKPPICERTTSIWDFINQPDQIKLYISSEYDPSLDSPTASPEADMGVLLPNPKDVRFWFELFKQDNDSINGTRQWITEQTQGVEIAGPFLTGEGDPVIERDPAVAAKAATILSENGLSSRTMVAARQKEMSSPYSTPLRTSSPVPRTGSPGNHGSNDSWHNVDTYAIPTASSSSRSRDRPTSSRFNNDIKSSPSRNKTVQSGSWGWSNFSSGALTALQGAAKELSGAAKEIRTIGTDAYTNFANPTAAGNGDHLDLGGNGQGLQSRQDGGMSRVENGWSNDYQGPSTSTSKIRTLVDSNPWSTSTHDAPTAPTDHSATRTEAAVKPALNHNISTSSLLRSPADAWGSVATERDQQASRGAGSVIDRFDAMDIKDVPTSTYSGVTLGPSVGPEPKTMGGSWDPLGVS